MEYNWKILRQENFILNLDDKLVNAILKGIERCNGHCPCYHGELNEDTLCPCKEYRINKHCRCNLYVWQNELQIQKDS